MENRRGREDLGRTRVTARAAGGLRGGEGNQAEPARISAAGGDRLSPLIMAGNKRDEGGEEREGRMWMED